MTTFLKISLLIITSLIIGLFSCGLPTTVRVGVGVHVPGAWSQPVYPTGSVGVGRPSSGYYPIMDRSLKDKIYTSKALNNSEAAQPVEQGQPIRDYRLPFGPIE